MGPSLEELAAALRATHEQAAATARTTFAGLRVPVTPGELLRAEIIGQDVYEQLNVARPQPRTWPCQAGLGAEVLARHWLHRGCCCLGPRSPSASTSLQEGAAQARHGAHPPGGAGSHCRSSRSQREQEILWRSGAEGHDLPEVFAKLLSSSAAVTGYTDPYTGQISLPGHEEGPHCS